MNDIKTFYINKKEAHVMNHAKSNLQLNKNLDNGGINKSADQV